jgi:peptidoglycan/LPS O-acetylase OafA/YrhL
MRPTLYYPIVNFLRGIAALMVCVYHMTNYADYRGSFLPESSSIPEIGALGIQGVYIFFVITGFVIPLSLYRSKFKLKQIFRFLAKRWVRIEIPYLFSIAAIFGSWYVISFIDFREITFDFNQLMHHLFYTIPFSGKAWYNPIYWTLAIEFQFYLFIALVYPLLISVNNKTRIASLLVLASTCFLPLDSRFVFHYMPVFAIGILLFYLKTNQLSMKWAIPLFLIFNIFTYVFLGIEVALSASFAAILIAFVKIDNKLFNKLGEISYSLYLIHGAIGGSFIYLFWGWATNYTEKLIMISIAIAASIIGSTIFWWLFENPSKKWSKKIGVSLNSKNSNE